MASCNIKLPQITSYNFKLKITNKKNQVDGDWKRVSCQAQTWYKEEQGSTDGIITVLSTDAHFTDIDLIKLLFTFKSLCISPLPWKYSTAQRICGFIQIMQNN